jgi:hypothetical protein
MTLKYQVIPNNKFFVTIFCWCHNIEHNDTQSEGYTEQNIFFTTGPKLQYLVYRVLGLIMLSCCAECCHTGYCSAKFCWPRCHCVEYQYVESLNSGCNNACVFIW